MVEEGADLGQLVQETKEHGRKSSIVKVPMIQLPHYVDPITDEYKLDRKNRLGV